MRHKVKRKKLNMQRDHRKALLRNLATSIILFENVKTTSAKAKQVRPIVERLITKAKTKDTVTAIRQIERVVFDDKAGKKLIEVLKDRYKDRPGGYTRIIKLGHRAGDAAEMVQIQLV
ncbi:50S ribosomal protein L17 [Candidatus Peregrinibacteria bacterium]|jgi:large subunit ribosomal protein L17|nr:50S ribosomal protein L17 [Candidatus Peregrinibacteria bacterium]MBT4631651.1 50S ribosomal protein L17 [Candidatus Peregrinibacteria bacterium]MBT5516779.1 50S ribosomal protein L17 [Candidatus Peregrinibacteria bacterium]MBT5823939.1 50S ribosomal protein L17 [Candidatus Peregrinibacteria bacterium]